MKRVTSSEAARNFSQLSDLALSDPVVVTKNGRDRLVLLGIDEYNFLIDTIDELSAKNSDAAPPRLGRYRTVARNRRNAG
ncbi:MAG: type II toxin-antitoxin system Phd/YefM family antitoxin [Hyphomicrobiales bacterium]|nr:type II toxin-antitoxin system Phd/YefM family antitoxin [Hyphomicrobiales bacterium]MCC2109216.1 type II toxin-antitoxin system Phd/YefM family antitoxin [Hyphomicrobiales bacterium]